MALASGRYYASCFERVLSQRLSFDRLVTSHSRPPLLFSPSFVLAVCAPLLTLASLVARRRRKPLKRLRHSPRAPRPSPRKRRKKRRCFARRQSTSRTSVERKKPPSRRRGRSFPSRSTRSDPSECVLRRGDLGRRREGLVEAAVLDEAVDEAAVAAAAARRPRRAAPTSRPPTPEYLPPPIRSKPSQPLTYSTRDGTRTR